MQIIIAGLGKVGMCLAGELSAEGHDLTVVDTKPEQVRKATSKFDIMGFSGNAADPDTLAQLDVADADLFIAVTTQDEVNLLSCLLAKRAGCSKTIARVRNPEYSSSMDYLKEALGLEMIINPELLAAKEIERVLSLPGAMNVDDFTSGHGEILKLRIQPGSCLDGLRVKEIHSHIHAEVLVCICQRGKETYIPDGDFVLHARDLLYIAGARAQSVKFFSSAGLPVGGIRHVMAVGAGKLSHYLIELLERAGIETTIIDKDLDACERMTVLYPDTVVIHADASSQNVLLEEGLEEMDAFIAMTGVDEQNVFLSLFAQRKADLKTVTKVTHIDMDELFEDFELDTVINPKTLSAEYIIRHVRALANSMGSNIRTVHRLASDQAEALEFQIREGSKVIGVPLMRLALKSGVLIALIERKGMLILPRGNDVILPGDLVVVITNRKGFTDVDDILEGKKRIL